MSSNDEVSVRMSVRLATKVVMFSSVALSVTGAFAAETQRPVSKVVRLTHMAVILPELERTREDWDCDELWTPNVEQVSRAEKVILERIKQFADSGRRVYGKKITVHERYVIQYFGIVLDKRKWIVCFIINTRMFQESASVSNEDLAETLEGVFSVPYRVYDTDAWFDAYYDPAANRLSESMGFLDEEPAEKPEPEEKAGRGKGVGEGAGHNRQGAADQRAAQERSSDPSWPQVMRRRWQHRRGVIPG
jgi:hypothetical protein